MGKPFERSWGRWRKRSGVMAVVAIALAGWTVVGQDDPLTNDDVVRLVTAGLGEAVIVAKIEGSATSFDTSVDALVALSQAGVDDDVIAAMVKAARTASRPVAATETPTPARTPSAPLAPAPVPVPAVRQDVTRPQAMPGTTFRDRLRGGGEGPEMVVIPAGRFRMGCLSNDADCFDDEKPFHDVAIPAPFALSAYEVTFADYDRFTHPNKVSDQGWGRGTRPVINVSWDDAREYVAWLSSQTGAEYRLPSEAEWEYAARAGTATKYSWGNAIGVNLANCDDWGSGGCGSQWDGNQTAPVGSFGANGFGLYDMHGNVWEWVEDCWNASYVGAPSDASPWLRGDCAKRVLRGGSWYFVPRDLRAADRSWLTTGGRYSFVGFRVARTLAP